jgi:tyrosyl-tRNA synthetase
MPTHTDFLSDMKARGLVHQSTPEVAFTKHLSTGVRKAYVGFDPTADSLTIGNAVGILVLARWQRCGHIPVAVMGGGTGLIGDPSGKSAERQLNTKERVAANVAKIRTIFDRVLDFAPALSNRAVMLDNADWLGAISYLDALRDIGKYFSVNQMIQKESVRERLHNREQGISYTEFSYMVLQAYDFAHLYRAQGVSVQMGGSDQWGNIVSGTDLLNAPRGAMLRELGELNAARKEGPSAELDQRIDALEARIAGEPEHEAHALTWPLVTKADGTKFGKTESGAVWLTAERTSPYAFFQFWLNSADADALRFLRTFTLLSMEEIAAIEAAHAPDPGKREAQRALARHVTTLFHGASEADAAEKAGRALFSGDFVSLPEALLRQVIAEIPSSSHEKGGLSAGVPLLDLLVSAGVTKSRGEAKDALAQGSVQVNGVKAAPDRVLRSDDLLHGSVIIIKRGKKWHVAQWA